MNIYPSTLSTISVTIHADDSDSAVWMGERFYTNSARGRTQLEAECSAEIVQAVYAVWGDAPTVEEPAPTPQPEQGPSETDILGQQVAALTLAGAEKDALISQLGAQMVQAQLDIAALKGGAGA
jgi:hypothetical protein